MQIIPLIRNIIDEIRLKGLNVSDSQLNSAQKAGIEHQLIACKLLEILVNKTVDYAEAACCNTRKMLSKLCGEQATSRVNICSILVVAHTRTF